MYGIAKIPHDAAENLLVAEKRRKQKQKRRDLRRGCLNGSSVDVDEAVKSGLRSENCGGGHAECFQTDESGDEECAVLSHIWADTQSHPNKLYRGSNSKD